MEILIVLWLLFFISHSVLATPSVKAYFKIKLKEKFIHYRLYYNIIAAVLLLLIVLQIFNTKQQFFFEMTLLTYSLGFTLVMAGFIVAQEAFNKMNMRAFFGLDTAGEESQGLITEGVYKIVRHPLYFGLFLFLIGLFWIIPSEDIALCVVLSIVYIAIGIEFEEMKLRQTFGEAYKEYAKNKSKFIPFVY